MPTKGKADELTTRHDLETAIRQKQFREDLYYRLSVMVIMLPPLRNRKEDIPDLVRYFLQKHPELLNDRQKIRDICASVQAAIVEVLVTKTIRAAKRLGVGCVTASGGVTCNSALRRELEDSCQREKFILRLAEQRYCTDNAAMIGILAERKLMRGIAGSELDVEIAPGMSLS